jgi:hypothetical protein
MVNLEDLQMLTDEICNHYSLGTTAQVSLAEKLIDNRAAEIVVGGTPKHTETKYESHVFEVKVLRKVTERGLDFMCFLIAHEIAHAFLYSRDVAGKESELMTDLCACMAGFLPYYDKVYRIKGVVSIDQIWKDQWSNIRNGGNRYISKYEFEFVKRAVQGAYALRAGQNFFNLLK